MSCLIRWMVADSFRHLFSPTPSFFYVCHYCLIVLIYSSRVNQNEIFPIFYFIELFFHGNRFEIIFLIFNLESFISKIRMRRNQTSTPQLPSLDRSKLKEIETNILNIDSCKNHLKIYKSHIIQTPIRQFNFYSHKAWKSRRALRPHAMCLFLSSFTEIFVYRYCFYKRIILKHQMRIFLF